MARGRPLLFAMTLNPLLASDLSALGVGHGVAMGYR